MAKRTVKPKSKKKAVSKKKSVSKKKGSPKTKGTNWATVAQAGSGYYGKKGK